MAEVQRRARGAEAVGKLPERCEQVGVPVRRSVATVGQASFEAENGKDLVGARRRSQRRVVGEAEVTSEPGDADAHEGPYSRLAGDSSNIALPLHTAVAV